MKEDNTFMITNAVKTVVVWIAGCGAITYGIAKTGRLSPLLCLFLLPKFNYSYNPRSNPHDDEVDIVDITDYKDEKEDVEDVGNEERERVEEQSNQGVDGEVEERV